MKIVKLEDGTIVAIEEIATPVNAEMFDARIAGLKNAIENIQKQIDEISAAKAEYEKLIKK